MISVLLSNFQFDNYRVSYTSGTPAVSPAIKILFLQFKKNKARFRMLLVLHLEEAYRFPGASCPTEANIRGQMSHGGKCPGADVLWGECPGEADVQGADVLRRQMPKGQVS